MISELIARLAQLPDSRRGAGRRHPVGLVVLVSIMAVISGMSSYRAMGDFVQANEAELRRRLGVKRLPSYPTIRRVLMHLPVEALAQALSSWGGSFPAAEAGMAWVHMDGKAIKGTVKGYRAPGQDFVSVVSLFFAPGKWSLAAESFHNKHTSEVQAVEALLERVALRGVVFTADALHAQKNA